MGRYRDIAKARRLYRGFREAEPKKVRRVSFRMPDAVMSVGYVDFVGYTTTHRGEVTRYKHDFAASSRPLLCTDGRRLFIVGGRYRFTSRGIVDLDSKGREQE